MKLKKKKIEIENNELNLKSTKNRGNLKKKLRKPKKTLKTTKFIRLKNYEEKKNQILTEQSEEKIRIVQKNAERSKSAKKILKIEKIERKNV